MWGKSCGRVVIYCKQGSQMTVFYYAFYSLGVKEMKG